MRVFLAQYEQQRKLNYNTNGKELSLLLQLIPHTVKLCEFIASEKALTFPFVLFSVLSSEANFFACVSFVRQRHFFQSLLVSLPVKRVAIPLRENEIITIKSPSATDLYRSLSFSLELVY